MEPCLIPQWNVDLLFSHIFAVGAINSINKIRPNSLLLFFFSTITKYATTLALSRWLKHASVLSRRVLRSLDRLLFSPAGSWAMMSKAGFFFHPPRILHGVAAIKLTSVYPLAFLRPSWAHSKSFLAGRAAPASPRPLSTPSLCRPSSSIHHNGFLSRSTILNHPHYFFSNVLKGSGSFQSVLPPAESQDPQSIPCPNMNLSHNCCICSQSDLLDLLAASSQSCLPSVSLSLSSPFSQGG